LMVMAGGISSGGLPDASSEGRIFGKVTGGYYNPAGDGEAGYRGSGGLL